MVEGNGKQVYDDGVGGAPQLPFPETVVEVVASNWGDELRDIVKRMDQSHEWMRSRLNNLIHAMEKEVVVP